MSNENNRKNLLANYAGQVYVAVVGIVVMPLYLHYLGAEAYGLVGFFTLIQSWMYLFDLGMSPALGREVVVLRHDVKESWRIRVVLRSFETIFISLGLVTAFSIFSVRHFVVNDWLKIVDLNPADVSTAVCTMALIIGFRWIATLHKSLINAYEEQVWLNVAEVILATARFPGALAVISIANERSYLYFFAFQLLVSVIEVLVVSRKAYEIIPAPGKLRTPCICVHEIRRVAPFAASIAYSAGIWILISQFDKLILSKALTLKEYGYFTLVATVCTGISTLTAPISKVFLPRMTALATAKSDKEFVDLYRKGAELVLISVVPVVTSIALYPVEVITIWTGDRNAAAWVESILPVYVIGYGILALGSVQYWLQYARGDLRLHVWYNSIYGLVTIPVTILAVKEFGVDGAAWCWLILRGITYIFWLPYVHAKFIENFHSKWVFREVFLPIFICVGIEFVLGNLLKAYIGTDRWSTFVGLCFLTAAGFFSILALKSNLVRNS